MPRSPEVTFVSKFGSKSIGTPEGEPRKRLIQKNADELAQVRESGLVVILSSGAELFGRRQVLTPQYRSHLRERKNQIHEECRDDLEELERRLKEVNDAVTRDMHRAGQVRLTQMWGDAFAKHGTAVLPELLDGQARDLSLDIKLADDRGSILVFNGHGSLEPDGKAGDNDLNLPEVVNWVAPHVNEDPEDSRVKLFVLGVTDPGTNGLLNTNGSTIEIYRGTGLSRIDHPDKLISKGGPESKGLAFFAIKEAHPRSKVGISGNRGGIIKDFRYKGKADTVIELKRQGRKR